MSVFAKIFLLIIGAVIVYFIFKDEKQRFNNGKMGLYVKVRKVNSSEQDFIAKLKVSIFKSFIIRFVIIGVLSGLIYAYVHKINAASLEYLEDFSVLDYLVMWVSFSMIAMVNRASTAKWNRF